MQMHDVIGRGAAVLRRRKGWTQEQAARAYRAHGLATWRRGTVGDLEVGRRRLWADDVLLICIALGTTLDALIEAADESGAAVVELAPGVALSAQAVREYLRPGADSRPAGPQCTADAVPTDAESRAAKQLGTSPAEIRHAALTLWSRAFDEERDSRIAGVAVMGQRSRQARRGLAARQMLAEVADYLRVPEP